MLLQGSTVAGMVRRPEQHHLFLDFIKETARLWLTHHGDRLNERRNLTGNRPTILSLNSPL